MQQIKLQTGQKVHLLLTNQLCLLECHHHVLLKSRMWPRWRLSHLFIATTQEIWSTSVLVSLDAIIRFPLKENVPVTGSAGGMWNAVKRKLSPSDEGACMAGQWQVWVCSQAGTLPGCFRSTHCYKDIMKLFSHNSTACAAVTPHTVMQHHRDSITCNAAAAAAAFGWKRVFQPSPVLGQNADSLLH